MTAETKRDPRRIDRAGIRARRNRGPLRTVGEIARATDPRREGRRRHAAGEGDAVDVLLVLMLIGDMVQSRPANSRAL